LKRGWFVLTIILFLIATLMLIDSVYWIVIGYSTQYGEGFVFGTFILPVVFYLLSYKAGKKAKME